MRVVVVGSVVTGDRMSKQNEWGSDVFGRRNERHHHGGLMDLTRPEQESERTGPIPVISAGIPFPARTVPSRRWRTRLIIGGVVLALVVAAAAGGVWVGWRWAVDRDVVSAGGAVASAEPAVAAQVRTPDVRGMRLADAKQALADSGGDPTRISTVAVAAALEPGTVVAQDPVGGEAITGPVELRVAKAAVMPAIADRAERDVVTELTAFGARVKVQQRYVPGTKSGTVVETQPPAGQPVPAEVVVVVAAAPSSVFLDEVSLLSGGCSTGELKINGTAFRHGLTCSVGTETTVEVLLDRGIGRITATVGVPDTGEPTDAVRLVVVGDGRELARVDLTYGASKPIDLATQGVLRLSMSVTRLSGADTSPSLALGDPTLLGAPDTVAGLDR